MITVKWNNTTANGSLKVSLSSCDVDTFNTVSKTETYHILSISGKTPETVSGLNAVPFNSGSQPYSVSKLVYPNLGPSNPTNLSVDSYKWKIPQGWTLNGVVSNGNTIYEGLSESITVIPNATSSGSITVLGHSDCGSGYDSDPSSITISRVFPSDLAITTTTSNDYLQGNKTPITYSVPNWSYATYSWSKPATWQF